MADWLQTALTILITILGGLVLLGSIIRAIAALLGYDEDGNDLS